MIGELTCWPSLPPPSDLLASPIWSVSTWTHALLQPFLQQVHSCALLLLYWVCISHTLFSKLRAFCKRPFSLNYFLAALCKTAPCSVSPGTLVASVEANRDVGMLIGLVLIAQPLGESAFLLFLGACLFCLSRCQFCGLEDCWAHDGQGMSVTEQIWKYSFELSVQFTTQQYRQS